jgi:hypothetical protein
MKRAIALTLMLFCGRAAAAGPITASLDGCVTLNDERLRDAVWRAVGTFQAVASDDPLAGCAPTIAHPVSDAFLFDDNRAENTLTAWLRLDRLPTCGRRQYDFQPYLADSSLDPLQLKSLVIDTGVSCLAGNITFGIPGPTTSMPEPWLPVLIGVGALAWGIRGRNQGRV